MPSVTTSTDCDAKVIDLARYRRTNLRSILAVPNLYLDSLVDFARYLRERAGGIGVSPHGLERLAVAFDLRRIRLARTLGSMIGDGNLSNEAQLALSISNQLAGELALPLPDPRSSYHLAYDLAHALDMLIAKLDMKAISTRYTVR